MSDVFVVSYPRSGTTWMQMVLHLLLTDGSLDFLHISRVHPWYERSLALGTNTGASLDTYPSPRVFKSHLPRRWLPSRGRFVYVVRDVADVVVSYFHFYRSHLGYSGTFDTFFERFLRGDVQYRSWFRHVAGWRRFADDPQVQFVTYRSLTDDRGSVVRTLAQFLGREVTDADVRNIVDRSSFDAMKAHESKFDPITEHLLDRGYGAKQFLRRGRSGDGHRMLSKRQQQRLGEAQPPRRRADLELRLASFLH